MSLDVVGFLRELVRIPSVSGEERAIADFMFAALAKCGLEVEREGDNLLATLRRGDGPTLWYLSHLDTVPAGSGWTRDAFAGEVEGESIYGRGSNDAKASVAAMASAAAALVVDGAGIRGSLALAFTTREETDNSGMARLLERFGRPDGAVCGEPTGLAVVRAQSGLAVLKAEWDGQACHAAHVGRVAHDNALLKAARDLASLPPYLKVGDAHPLLGDSTLAVTVLEAGQRHNVVPARAEALADGRIAPPHSADDALAVLRAALPQARVSVRSARLAPFETAAGHPFVLAALAAAGKSDAVGSSTLSDMALLQGVPAVKCGPGQTARSHTADEYVTVAELRAGFEFYCRAAPRLLAAISGATRMEVAR